MNSDLIKHLFSLLFSVFIFIGNGPLAQAQERCAELELFRTRSQVSNAYDIIDLDTLRDEVLTQWQKSQTAVTTDMQKSLMDRLILVRQALLPQGELDRFFAQNKLDPNSAVIYLYGTTASLKSQNPLKRNHFWTINSDIDFIISIKDFTGHFWRLARGPNKATSIQDVPIEVQSLYLQAELDTVLFNEFGMEVMLPEQTQIVPDYAILVRQPI